MQSQLKSVLPILVLASLSACGGGGGDDPDTADLYTGSTKEVAVTNQESADTLLREGPARFGSFQ